MMKKNQRNAEILKNDFNLVDYFMTLKIEDIGDD